MKQNKLLATAYSLLPIAAGLSSANVVLAEEQLAEIKVEDTALSADKPAVVRKTHKDIQQELIRDTRLM